MLWDETFVSTLAIENIQRYPREKSEKKREQVTHTRKGGEEEKKKKNNNKGSSSVDKRLTKAFRGLHHRGLACKDKQSRDIWGR